MTKGYFITGTDTECGKTEITLGLMQRLQSDGHSVLGMKPVASGATATPAGLRNDDARRIRHQASTPTEYDLVNPFAFEPPVAPHVAAEKAGMDILFAPILESFRELSGRSDLVVVEGVGGWRVPLGSDGAVSDLAATLGLPVVLVVGIKLGCINHALLTAESIMSGGLRLAGWVANTVDPEMLEPEASIATLEREIAAPCLGVIPCMRQITAQAVAERLQLPGPV
jgi:dethiobiotin synthetase